MCDNSSSDQEIQRGLLMPDLYQKKMDSCLEKMDSFLEKKGRTFEKNYIFAKTDPFYTRCNSLDKSPT
jgi:hypothetical protein